MSEFGKGFILPLVKFTEHLGLGYKEGSPDLKRLMYGASDHLYEVEIPAEFESVRDDYQELIDYAFDLRMGETTKEDLLRITGLVFRIARGIDEALGIEGDIGEW